MVSQLSSGAQQKPECQASKMTSPMLTKCCKNKEREKCALGIYSQIKAESLKSQNEVVISQIKWAFIYMQMT